jgi:hypothetical protein
VPVLDIPPLSGTDPRVSTGGLGLSIQGFDTRSRADPLRCIRFQYGFGRDEKLLASYTKQHLGRMVWDELAQKR